MALSVWNLSNKVRSFLKSYDENDFEGGPRSGPHKGTPGYFKWMEQFKKWAQASGIAALPEEGTPEFKNLEKKYKEAKKIEAANIFAKKQPSETKREQEFLETSSKSNIRSEKNKEFEEKEQYLKDWINIQSKDDAAHKLYMRTIAFSVLNAPELKGKGEEKREKRPSLETKIDRINKIQTLLKEFSTRDKFSGIREVTTANMMKTVFGGAVSPSLWVISLSRKEGKQYDWARKAALDLLSPAIYSTSLARLSSGIDYQGIEPREVVSKATEVALEVLNRFVPTIEHINDPGGGIKNHMSTTVPAVVKKELYEQKSEEHGVGHLPYKIFYLGEKIEDIREEAISSGKVPTDEYIFKNITKIPEFETRYFGKPIKNPENPKEKIFKRSEKEAFEKFMGEKRILYENVRVKLEASGEEEDSRSEEELISQYAKASEDGLQFEDPALEREFKELKNLEKVVVGQLVDKLTDKLSPGLAPVFRILITPSESSQEVKKPTKSNSVIYAITLERFMQKYKQQGKSEEEARKLAESVAKREANRHEFALVKEHYSIDTVLPLLLNRKKEILNEYENGKHKKDSIYFFLSEPHKYITKNKNVKKEIKDGVMLDFKKFIEESRKTIAYDKAIAEVFKNNPIQENDDVESWLARIRDSVSSSIIEKKKQMEKEEDEQLNMSIDSLWNKFKKQQKGGAFRQLDLEEDFDRYSFLDRALLTWWLSLG